MKPSFKTTTILAASGMSIYTGYVFLRQVPAINTWICSLRGLGSEIFFTAWMYLLLGAMIAAIIAVVRFRPMTQTRPKTSFRIMTYILAGVLLLSVLVALLIPVHISGAPYLYVHAPWRYVLLLLAFVWMWMLPFQSSLGSVSKSLRVAALIGAGVLCVPILLQLLSGISYFATGHILFLRSWAVASWVRYLVPTALICWYSIELIRNKY